MNFLDAFLPDSMLVVGQQLHCAPWWWGTGGESQTIYIIALLQSSRLWILLQRLIRKGVKIYFPDFVLQIKLTKSFQGRTRVMDIGSYIFLKSNVSLHTNCIPGIQTSLSKCMLWSPNLWLLPQWNISTIKTIHSWCTHAVPFGCTLPSLLPLISANGSYSPINHLEAIKI
jgi:hypothetical protein